MAPPGDEEDRPRPWRRPELSPGVFYLIIVAILWGSYSPALRYAFTLPGPPTAEVLTAGRGVLQAALLLGASLLAPRGPVADEEGPALPEERPLLLNSFSSQDEEESGGGGGFGSSEAAAGQRWQQVEGAPPSRLRLRALGARLRALPLEVLGGLEIGLYNTLGTASQAWGLQTTGATRAAFLIQAWSVFTPALAAATGRPPTRAAWAGSALALVGTILVTLDEAGAGGGAAAAAAAGAAGQAPLVSLGDGAILFGALCYSAATVRIPAYRSVPPVRLALGKSATLAVVSVGVLAAQVAGLLLGGQPLAEALWPGYANPAAWAILVWSAVGPGALSAYLHVKGQATVSPTTAQIVFSSVPLWSVAIAAVFLHDEHAGLLTWLGGAAVVGAGFVSALGR